MSAIPETVEYSPGHFAACHRSSELLANGELARLTMVND